MSKFLIPFCLLLFAPLLGAQPVSLPSLPPEGMLLDKGWKFHLGDNPAWAKPDFDDSAWQGINPAVEIGEMTPLLEGKIGWFRLKIKPDASLLNQALAMLIIQRGASEIYLDGKLIHRLGKVSTDPEQEVVYNPNNTPLPVVFPRKAQLVLAVRYSFTTESFRYLLNDWPGQYCLAIRLQKASDATATLVYRRSYEAFRDYAKAGYLFAFGLLHLLLFTYYPARRANLYYALGTLGNSVYYLLHYLRSYFPQEGHLLFPYYFLLNLFWGQAFLWFLVVVYSIIQERIGLLFWGVVVAMFLSVKFAVFLPVFVLLLCADAVRVSWLGFRRRVPDAKLSMVGWAGHTGFVGGFYLFYFRILPPSPLLVDILYNGSIVWLTTMFSLLLAREYAHTNRSLSQKLEEVQTLSAQTLAQQEEKQELLASENERLERQVRERTEEIQAQNQVLAVQAKKLREQDQVKSRFITNLTHEFRTPLSLILSPVEKLLQDRATPVAIGNLLSVVGRNARQLLLLVNQLLDLSKLDAGHMSKAEQTLQPAQLLEDVLELFRPQLESKQLQLAWQQEGGQEYYLLDSDKWQKIIRNLFSNAVKFTPKGGSIRVGLQVQDSKALIQISDTGKGIPSDKLPFLFERFYQVDDSSTRVHEGTGIGLALVKELTGFLGGEISIESKVNQGTTCYLVLPLAPAGRKALLENQSAAVPAQGLVAAALTTPAVAIPADASGEKPLLLLAEDNEDLCTFLTQELGDYYRVVAVGNGEEAWEIVRHELPDLVVSDVMMPGLDGFALTHLIKSTPLTSHIAVVLLTARTAQESKLEGLTQGADEYLTKPFQAQELHLRLRNLLSRREQLQAYFRRQLLPERQQGETLLPQAQEVLAGPARTPLDPFLTHLYHILELHLDESSFGAEALAQELAMSRRTLHRKISALTNLSAQELLRQYRLKRATELLLQGHNVSETAYLVGYESASHFTATFKAFYQQTPTEFLAK